MTAPRRSAARGAVTFFFVLTVALAALAPAPGRAAEKPASPALAGFADRVKDYLKIKEKAAAPLPHLSKESTPQEVVRHQRALAAGIRQARAGAKPGDFFTSDIEALVKRTVNEVLSGDDGPSVKASIRDENPDVPRIKLHEQYPTSVPLSTMPPSILASLPELPKGLEYRFLGSRLVLLDTDADIILDYTGAVMPA
jgi:hypothetical protein